MSKIAKAKAVCFVIFIFLLTGCTYTINMVHTEGSASDVVDDTASTSPSIEVSPEFTIPQKFM